MKSIRLWLLALLLVAFFGSQANAQAVRLDGRTSSKRVSTRIGDVKLSAQEAKLQEQLAEVQLQGKTINTSRPMSAIKTTPRRVIVTRQKKNKEKRNISSFELDQ